MQTPKGSVWRPQNPTPANKPRRGWRAEQRLYGLRRRSLVDLPVAVHREHEPGRHSSRLPENSSRRVRRTRPAAPPIPEHDTYSHEQGVTIKAEVGAQVAHHQSPTPSTGRISCGSRVGTAKERSRTPRRIYRNEARSLELAPIQWFQLHAIEACNGRPLSPDELE